MVGALVGRPTAGPVRWPERRLPAKPLARRFALHRFARRYPPRPLAPFGRLNDVCLVEVERIWQQRLHAECAEGMRRATVTHDDPAPVLEQTIDGAGSIREGDAAVAEHRHPRPALEVDGSDPVVDEVAECAFRVAGSRFVEIDDETAAGGGGQAERSDVVQNRITRTNCEGPVDEVSLSHEPERTKPTEEWEGLDNTGRVP